VLATPPNQSDGCDDRNKRQGENNGHRDNRSCIQKTRRQSGHRDHQQGRVVAEIPATETPNRLQDAGLNLDRRKLSDLPEDFDQPVLAELLPAAILGFAQTIGK